MCGIAGYSLSSRSAVDRTLAAQSLLAGIAERGADAVGYAHRARGDEYAVVTKQRTPASSLLERISVPQAATELLVHVRDYTKGHPSIAANNHPVRHGPIVGIHNGIILNDDELLAQYSCARSEPRMTVDSEAIFALAAHSKNDPLALQMLTGSLAAAWLDPLAHEELERRPGTAARVEHAVDLPLREERVVQLARLGPVGELREPPELPGERDALLDCPLQPLLPHRHVEARLTERVRERAERVPVERLGREP